MLLLVVSIKPAKDRDERMVRCHDRIQNILTITLTLLNGPGGLAVVISKFQMISSYNI